MTNAQSKMQTQAVVEQKIYARNMTKKEYRRNYYLNNKDKFNKKKLNTKCGCRIIINSRDHDECRCDGDGENWICADCYDGEYDEDGFENCDCGYIHHCEDKCPNETTRQHYERWKEEENLYKLN